MSTKPRATIEYMIPDSSPPTRTSIRKRNSSIARSSMRDAEIGVDHVLVGAHFAGRAVANLLAVIEHDHAVGDVHHHAHVVLDEHHRGSVVIVDVEDEAAHVLLLLDVHAGHGLVEQQDLGFGGQGAAEFNALLQ